MNEELNALRDQIDAVDQQLVALLAQRLALVAEVGEVKSRHGLPIYAPDREAAMLAKRREEAEQRGVPGDLIEDVLRRVMRESYSSENDSGFKCVNPQLRPIVVVGGAGQLGGLFVHMFRLSGYQVDILETEDWPRADALLANAGMVVLSRSQLATPAEMDSTVNYLNHALKQNGCARRFGADVLRKNWEDLTPQDLAAVAACGSKQASYEKMHFDQHDVFSSLYFIDRHLPLPRLKEVVNELFADASCGRIMRIKGFTSDGNGWLELNASRDAMTLKPIAKAQEVIIVIGEQLNRAAIEAHWKEV